MSFLTPWSALLAALIAIPILLLLYFLRLRRQPQTVPSTLLWQAAVRDLQANAPFQRLRLSWLFFIQLLILILLAIALGRPLFGSADAAPGRVILILDSSASMKARLPGLDRSRFDVALDVAQDAIDRLASAGKEPEVMIITAGPSARVVFPPATDLRAARATLQSLTPVDGEAALQPALRLAEAYVSASNGETAAAPAHVIVITDGRPAGDLLQPPEFASVETLNVLEGVEGDHDNVGIVTLAARRDYDDPTLLRLLVGLSNSSVEAQTVALSLRLPQGDPVVRSIEIPPADSEAGIPGEAVVQFDLPDPTVDTAAAPIRLSHSHADLLATDDTATLVVQPVETGVLLVVTPDGAPLSWLQPVLDLMEFERIDHRSAADYNALADLPAPERAARLAGYSLILHQAVAPAFLPDVPTMTFGAAPPILDFERFSAEGDEPLSRRVLAWDRRHPILRDVELAGIVVADPHRLRIPETTAEELLIGQGGPLAAVARVGRTRHLVAAFDLVNTNWPLDVSFAIFMRNAVDVLLGQASDQAGRWFRIGDRVEVTAEAGVESLRLRSEEVDLQVAAEPSGSTVLPPLERVGFYTVEGAIPTDRFLPINLCSPSESNLLPAELVIESAAATGPQPRLSESPREIWRWAALAALGLLLLEWCLYLWVTRSL